MGMLTQYIGQSNMATPNRPSNHTDSHETSIIDAETKKLKELFLEKTDKLDKMQSHRDALNRAVHGPGLTPGQTANTNQAHSRGQRRPQIPTKVKRMYQTGRKEHGQSPDGPPV